LKFYAAFFLHGSCDRGLKKSGFVHFRGEPILAAQIQSTCFRPRLLFFENKFQENLEMVIDGEGKISKIAYVCDSPSDPHSSAPLVLLPAMAIFPGLCNGHSHAFQRGLRGGNPKPGK
jgi:hypothetical protein